jgi:hypothetical protein
MTSVEAREVPERDDAAVFAQRLVDAPDTGRLNAAEEYALLRSVLSESSKSSERWTIDAAEQLRNLLNDFTHSVEGKIECFRAACVADLAYLQSEVESSGLRDVLLERFLQLDWSGQQMFTGVRIESGQAMNAMILVRPHSREDQTNN